jgi:hypothetical protein
MQASDYGILAIAIALALLEGTHATAVDAIRRARPEVLADFGRTGPGYYFFRAYQGSPAYRKALLSGQLRAEFASPPELSRLLEVERFLWYAFWFVVLGELLVGWLL